LRLVATIAATAKKAHPKLHSASVRNSFSIHQVTP